MTGEEIVKSIVDLVKDLHWTEAQKRLDEASAQVNLRQSHPHLFAGPAPEAPLKKKAKFAEKPDE